MLRNEPDVTTVKYLSDDVLELALSNIYLMIEGQVETLLKNF